MPRVWQIRRRHARGVQTAPNRRGALCRGRCAGRLPAPNLHGGLGGGRPGGCAERPRRTCRLCQT
eukprot:2564100-Lingulodinium_polyedra.AAC.1